MSELGSLIYDVAEEIVRYFSVRKLELGWDDSTSKSVIDSLVPKRILGTVKMYKSLEKFPETRRLLSCIESSSLQSDRVLEKTIRKLLENCIHQIYSTENPKTAPLSHKFTECVSAVSEKEQCDCLRMLSTPTVPSYSSSMQQYEASSAQRIVAFASKMLCDLFFLADRRKRKEDLCIATPDTNRTHKLITDISLPAADAIMFTVSTVDEDEIMNSGSRKNMMNRKYTIHTKKSVTSDSREQSKTLNNEFQNAGKHPLFTRISTGSLPDRPLYVSNFFNDTTSNIYAEQICTHMGKSQDEKRKNNSVYPGSSKQSFHVKPTPFMDKNPSLPQVNLSNCKAFTVERCNENRKDDYPLAFSTEKSLLSLPDLKGHFYCSKPQSEESFQPLHLNHCTEQFFKNATSKTKKCKREGFILSIDKRLEKHRINEKKIQLCETQNFCADRKKKINSKVKDRKTVNMNETVKCINSTDISNKRLTTRKVTRKPKVFQLFSDSTDQHSIKSPIDPDRSTETTEKLFFPSRRLSLLNSFKSNSNEAVDFVNVDVQSKLDTAVKSKIFSDEIYMQLNGLSSCYTSEISDSRERQVSCLHRQYLLHQVPTVMRISFMYLEYFIYNHLSE
ncbi:unnamed protein product [Trichobilharzia szidati]|nr:unnamed protein product [Trichobilharzia szidati]